MNETLPTVLILAAGFSSRMGTLKANVSLQGKTFLARILDLIPESFPIKIVLGFQGDQIRLQHLHFHGQWVENSEFARGMITSLQAGLRALDDTCPGIWIWPVDFPCLQPKTTTTLFQTALVHPEQIVVPSYQYRRGHPVYVPKTCFSMLKQLPNETILRTILFQDSHAIFYVEVEDAGVLQNLNTLSDLQRFQEASFDHWPTIRLQEK